MSGFEKKLTIFKPRSLLIGTRRNTLQNIIFVARVKVISELTQKKGKGKINSEIGSWSNNQPVSKTELLLFEINILVLKSSRLFFAIS